MDKKTLKLGLAFVMALSIPTITSCKYDDDDLWKNVDDLNNRVEALEQKVKTINSDVEALRLIVSSLESNVTIISVTEKNNGYEIEFSDGKTALISDGKDGIDAPEISIRQEDGIYYWTLGGELLQVNGQPLPTTGPQGKPGENAVAPQLQINPDTKLWEISTDGGSTWTSTGVKAQGEPGNSIFSEVDNSNPDFVTFTLSDGSEFTLTRHDETAPIFAIDKSEGIQEFLRGESLTYNVTAKNISDYSISKPDGWKVTYSEGLLNITAPTDGNHYAETEGTIAVNLISASGRGLIAKITVKTVPFKLRILTFEDEDAKFGQYKLPYCDKIISTWSDLIDNKQYGGQMLYGNEGMGMDEPYQWHDANNTELRHVMPESYGSYCYWSGGHAISNYADTDLKNGDFTHQLSVYGNGGHNNSKNFAMHFGYIDNSSFGMTEHLPALEFADGTARTIDHIWVMNTTYAMNSYMSGNGLTPQIGPDDWVQLIATGYNASGTKTGEVKIYMCNGPDNIVRDWTKWDLSPLGNIVKVEFNITGSSDNGYGFSQPGYFAYDDVAVRFTE